MSPNRLCVTKQVPDKFTVSAGIVIPTGTISQKAPLTGMKYRKMLKYCQQAHPAWVKWTYSSPEECHNAVRYLKYFFRDRDKLEITTPRKKMWRTARGCFILMRAKNGIIQRDS